MDSHRNKKICLSLILFALLHSSYASFGASFKVAPADAIPWDFPQPKRIVAIGDIHADPEALKAILRHTKITDENEQWTGGESHLVLMGDLNGRGPSSRQVYDLLIRLSAEAEGAGGRVHALLGNHELLVHELQFQYASHTECEEWKDFGKYRKEMAEVKKFMSFGTKAEQAYGVAMTRREPYASFNAKRNTIIKLGSFLFVHGGLGDWFIDNSPANINATVRLWLEHYQGRGGLPDEKYGWVLEEAGPLWEKEISKKKRSADYVRDLLSRVGATQAVVGHVRTASREIEIAHEGQWVMIDTGISRAMHGKLSALEIDEKGGLLFHNDISRPEVAPENNCAELMAMKKKGSRK